MRMRVRVVHTWSFSFSVSEIEVTHGCVEEWGKRLEAQNHLHDAVVKVKGPPPFLLGEERFANSGIIMGGVGGGEEGRGRGGRSPPPPPGHNERTLVQ